MPGEDYTPEEIDKMIAEGLDDIERGDIVDGEEAFRQLRCHSAERRMQRTNYASSEESVGH
jgi:hypothetical protein